MAVLARMQSPFPLAQELGETALSGICSVPEELSSSLTIHSCTLFSVLGG